MEWQDTGTILSVRKHGETSVIVEVFTAEHGRHLGVVRGGVSRKMTPHLQPGGMVTLTWKARLEEHLGSFVFEPLKSRAGLLDDALALSGQASITAILHATLPEREPYGYLYAETLALLDAMEARADWPLAYMRWEMSVLEELGFALDLSACAVTGETDDLCYVSPRSGRAVSRKGAGEWADKLLPLPQCMLGQSSFQAAEVARALETTGYFMAKVLAELTDDPLPATRERFIDRLLRL